MRATLINFAKTIAAGLLLCVGVRARAINPQRPTEHFWLILLLGIGVSVLLQLWQLMGQPFVFTLEGLLADGFSALLLLGAAFVIVSRNLRSAFSLASVLLVAEERRLLRRLQAADLPSGSGIQ